MSKKKLTKDQIVSLLESLKTRFLKNMQRHNGITWDDVLKRIENNEQKLWSLYEMERTEGEPDVVAVEKKSGEITFMDCSAESPKGRRSLCYDRAALNSRKEFKPTNSAMDMASEMGIKILTEDDFIALLKLGKFDTKTSSWVETPDDIRKLGGAIFCDYRYNTVFKYHNGAESYYAARGFRGKVQV